MTAPPADRLPPRPSDLIDLAVSDFRSLDRDRYIPNSSIYHTRDRTTSLCHVCLAGAVIAGTLGIPQEKRATPSDLTTEGRISFNDFKRLMALDAARAARWRTMFNTLGMDPDRLPERDQVIIQLQDQTERNAAHTFLGWPELHTHLEHMQNCSRILRKAGC